MVMEFHNHQISILMYNDLLVYAHYLKLTRTGSNHQFFLLTVLIGKVI